jgi:8-oxo-dGTP pyrophosphatase MutT (NUDIX family)
MGITFSNAYWSEKIKSYSSTYEIELSYKVRFESLLLKYDNCFERSLLLGHITASAFILDNSKQHVLLMHHAKLNKWLQPGGHCDGNRNTVEVAKKEVLEETGIKIKITDVDIFDLDIHVIPERKGVQTHEHFDVRFLFIVPDNTPYVQNEESLALKWIPIQNIKEYTNEESILRMVEKVKSN